MRVVFFGTPNFALDSLKAIMHSGDDLLCVVTRPDRKKRRGLALEQLPVKSFAEKNKIKLFCPESVNEQDSLSFLKKLNADLFIVVAYGQILSQELIDIPLKFCINAHASLLPKYRGAAPINWALINGDKLSGVTIQKIALGLDSGDILLQQQLPIGSEDNFVSLESKLSRIASDLLVKALQLIREDKYCLKKQNEKLVSFAPKLKKEDGLIDFSSPALEINNLIRGCYFWPGAFTFYKDRSLKIFRALVLERRSEIPGKIIEVSKQGFVVSTGKFCLDIRELQIEGKRRMSAQEFLSGHKISIGEILPSKK